MRAAQKIAMEPTRTLNFTPLPALDAVAIDTETTGLSTADDRIVQFAAVSILDGNRLESMVNPGVPIPAESTAIHGISDTDLDEAPDTAEALKSLVKFVEGRIVVGHSISFDVAVLENEAVRSSVDRPEFRVLDIRQLAMAVAPPLPDFSLDTICSWLDIEIEGRHTAMGDALAAAEVFQRLIPMLRAVGVRTLAEAEAASRKLEARADGAVNAASAGEDGGRLWAIGLDGYAYSTLVRDVMSAPPVTLPGSTLVEVALKALIEKKISSVLVETGSGAEGIVTERDLIRTIAKDGAGALGADIAGLMSAPLECVGAHDLLYRAIGRIERRGIRHLGVRDEDGEIVGVVTTRNLLRHRSSAAIALGDEIYAASSPGELGQVWAQVPAVARSLTERDVSAVQVAATISAEICALTRRAAEFAEAELVRRGLGPAPHRYAVFVLGSAGRGESLIAADQDNALVIDAPALSEEDDAWFAELGDRMSELLDEIGIVECKGGVMARNATWRHSLQDWRAEIGHWVERQHPKDLLNVDIFFDAKCVAGDDRLLNDLWADAFERASRTPTFLRAMEGTLADVRPPFGFLGGFKTDTRDRVDLKMHGLFPIVSAARILAIKADLPERGTGARYDAVASAGLISETAAADLTAAHETITSAILQQQLRDVDAGLPPGTKVDPRILSKREQKRLRDAVRQSQNAIQLVREGMF